MLGNYETSTCMGWGCYLIVGNRGQPRGSYVDFVGLVVASVLLVSSASREVGTPLHKIKSHNPGTSIIDIPCDHN